MGEVIHYPFQSIQLDKEDRAMLASEMVGPILTMQAIKHKSLLLSKEGRACYFANIPAWCKCATGIDDPSIPDF